MDRSPPDLGELAMKPRKFKGKWVVDFKLPRTVIQMYGVKRFRKVYDKKAIADKVWGIVHEGIALNDKSGQIGKLLNVVKDEEGVGYTVQSFYQKWMDEYVTPQLEATTAARYKLSFKTILEFCGDMPLPDFTKATLHEYVAWRRKQTTKTRKKGEQISLFPSLCGLFSAPRHVLMERGFGEIRQRHIATEF